MRFIIGLAIAICLSQIPATGQPSEKYRPAQMQADLKQFKHVLEYAHPDIYAHITPKEFENFFQKLLAQTESPKTILEFYNIVLQLIAGIHDGHAQVSPSRNLFPLMYSNMLPFHSLVQNNKVFVTRNVSGKNIDDGSEILSINGIPAAKVIDTILMYYSGDGSCRSCMEYCLGSSYISLYYVFPLVFGIDTAYTLEVSDYKSKSVQTILVPAISYGELREREIKKYGNNLHTEGMDELLRQKAFSIDFKNAGLYAYMKINRFFKEDFEEPANIYRDFYSDAFNQIESKKAKNLVIDLRGNGGGIGSNAAYLVQYLTEKSFIPTTRITSMGNDDYYKSITSESLKLDNYFQLKKAGDNKYVVTNSDSILELREFKPIEKSHFSGKIYVLIDGGTVSAAAMAASLLKQYTNAVFVGQETGGHAGMSNGIRQLFIRGDSTGMSINIPIFHSEFSINKFSGKRGVIPDYIVENSIDDIIKGRDAMLEFVVKKISEK